MTAYGERQIADALEEAAINFHREGRDVDLDFFLPDYAIYIEVKSFHSPRAIEQLSRHDNVILIQGRTAIDAFCSMLRSRAIDA